MNPLQHLAPSVDSLTFPFVPLLYTHFIPLALVLELCRSGPFLSSNVICAVRHPAYYALYTMHCRVHIVYKYLLSASCCLSPCINPRYVRVFLTPSVGCVGEWADEKGNVVMLGRVLNRECDLNERVKRLPTGPLEILFGLKHDLVSPGLKRVRR